MSRKPKGVLYTRSGEKIAHTAESVILITSTVPAGGVGTRGEIFVDNEVLNMATYANMVGELLIIEAQEGEDTP